jgi:hypothetical protein
MPTNQAKAANLSTVLAQSRRSKGSKPHSWALSEWTEQAPDVYPNSTPRARYLFRSNNDSLVAAGAVVRVGRELVVLGDRYARWLERRAAHVPGYAIAANRPQASS